MNNEKSQASEVILSLRSFRNKIEAIINLIEEKTRVSPAEKTHLQSLLKELKDDLNKCARHGTTNGKKRPLTQHEDLFFSPAVSDAIVHLSMKTNSHPIKSNWHDRLSDAYTDINCYLHQLKESS